jgi:hypothetical protein
MKAFDVHCDLAIVLDIEEFIAEVVQHEPEKYQLYFYLGLINLYKKEDYVLAKRDFDRCLEDSKPEDAELRRQIEKHLGILEEAAVGHSCDK